MGQVLVGGPGLGLGLGDWDALLLGVLNQVRATLEALDKLGQTPRSNDLNVGLEGVEGKLETDLIVTLAGAAVGNGEAALLAGNVNLGAGNDGSGERGTEKVDILVDGVALDGGETELLDKLAADVLDDKLGGTNLESLDAGSLKVVL